MLEQQHCAMPAKELAQSTTPTAENPVLESGEDNGYPEGGLKAWLVVMGSWCAMIPSMGLLNTLGILHAWTSQHQLKDYSESSIGWIYGAYGFFLYIGGAQVGELFEELAILHFADPCML